MNMQYAYVLVVEEEVSSCEDQKSVRLTRKVIIYEETMEGTSSQVREPSQEMLNIIDGEIKSTVTDSTAHELFETKKKKEPLILRIRGQMETP
jgi:hypothetical protein